MTCSPYNQMKIQDFFKYTLPQNQPSIAKGMEVCYQKDKKSHITYQNKN